MLCDMLDTAEDPRLDDAAKAQQLQLSIVQALRSCHQFALDNGDWKAAWPMALVRDPYRPATFGGTEAELSMAAALLKAEADL